ncbi:MAG: hypothetical protein ACREGK_09015 [Geminicoccales bacterium]
MIECPEQRRINPIAEISGFDLGDFDVFRNPAAHQPFNMMRDPHRVLSAAFEMAQLDFRRLPVEERSRSVTLQVIADGIVHAVAFWFDLHLDDVVTLSTAPGSESRHWRQAVTFLDEDRPVRRGDTLRFTVGHTDSHFFFRWPGS